MHFLLMESIPFDQLAKKNDLFAKGVWSALREAAPNIQGAFASALCWFSTRVGLTMELLNVPLWEHKWAHCIAGERHAVYSVADCRQVFKLCQLCQSSTVAFFFRQPLVKSCMKCLIKKHSLRKFSASSFGRFSWKGPRADSRHVLHQGNGRWSNVSRRKPR